MKIVNIAQGSFYLVGGYIGYVVVRYTGNFYLAVVVTSFAIGILGMGIERFLLRGLEGQNQRQMLMTMGIALFFQDLLLIIFEGNPLSLTPPAWCAQEIDFGQFSFHVLKLFMIGTAAIIYFALWWFQEKTKAGSVLRAAIDNKEIAEGLGINVPFVTMGVFGLGALITAIGGVVGCGFTAIYPGIDFEVLPLSFVVVIVGGTGSLKGAVVGALIVGLVDNFGRAVFPELSYFTMFAPMAFILAVRPKGLFGKD
jgi:branched-chain amino acid transport system permease protein